MALRKVTAVLAWMCLLTVLVGVLMAQGNVAVARHLAVSFGVPIPPVGIPLRGGETIVQRFDARGVSMTELHFDFPGGETSVSHALHIQLRQPNGQLVRFWIVHPSERFAQGLDLPVDERIPAKHGKYSLHITADVRAMAPASGTTTGNQDSVVLGYGPGYAGEGNQLFLSGTRQSGSLAVTPIYRLSSVQYLRQYPSLIQHGHQIIFPRSWFPRNVPTPLLVILGVHVAWLLGLLALLAAGIAVALLL